MAHMGHHTFVVTNLLKSGATCRETPFLSCDPPPSNYFCLIQMLCHRCYLGANFWVNVFIFYYIGMVISISVLSFYSDGYYFSFHVVDILQSFGLLWWILVVPPFSHFGYLVINFFSQVKILFVFCFNSICTH